MHDGWTEYGFTVNGMGESVFSRTRAGAKRWAIGQYGNIFDDQLLFEVLGEYTDDEFNDLRDTGTIDNLIVNG